MLQSQTNFELYLQYIRGAGSIFWVLGHQVQVGRSMALKEKTHTVNFSFSTHFIPLDE